VIFRGGFRLSRARGWIASEGEKGGEEAHLRMCVICFLLGDKGGGGGEEQRGVYFPDLETHTLRKEKDV